MIARLLPGRRHLVLTSAEGVRLDLGWATSARHALRRRADLALTYGVSPHRIGVRVFAPRKGVPCA